MYSLSGAIIHSVEGTLNLAVCDLWILATGKGGEGEWHPVGGVAHAFQEPMFENDVHV